MKYRNSSLPEHMKEDLKKNKNVFCKKLWLWRLFGVLSFIVFMFYIPHSHLSTTNPEVLLLSAWFFMSLGCIFASSYRNSLWRTGCHGNSTLRNCIAKAYVCGVDKKYVLFSFEKAHKYIDGNELYTLDFDGYTEYLYNFSSVRPLKRSRNLDRDMVMMYEPFSPWGELHTGDEVYMIYRYRSMKKMVKLFNNEKNYKHGLMKMIKKNACVPNDAVIVLKEKKEV